MIRLRPLQTSWIRTLCVILLPAIGCGMIQEDSSNMKLQQEAAAMETERDSGNAPILIFLGGDVVTGRGIDQVLPHPSNPRLFEPYVKDAVEYVRLAQQAHGEFSYPVDFTYPWGVALKEWNLRSPDLKIINLETSVTGSDDFWKGKGVHYRMHPKNAPVLKASGIDFCSLANNHSMDWGYRGLRETLETLNEVPVKYSGAGRNLQEAAAPAVFDISGKGAVRIFSYGFESSGIPIDWAATDQMPGVNLLAGLSNETTNRVIDTVRKASRPSEIIVVSVHWGGNWGYEIPAAQIEFAHRLIDEAGVDILHGHSSHHCKGIEIYHGKLVLYGCGDLLNDYEGIEGFENYRGDLSLMYFASVAADGSLDELRMVPVTMRRFRLAYARQEDAAWLRDTLNRESKRFATRVDLNEEDHSLSLRGP